MTEFLKFIGDHPWLSFFLAYLLVSFLKFCINRPLRHLNIYKHGYPPSHCDADGDFRKEDDRNDAAAEKGIQRN